MWPQRKQSSAYGWNNKGAFEFIDCLSENNFLTVDCNGKTLSTLGLDLVFYRHALLKQYTKEQIKQG